MKGRTAPFAAPRRPVIRLLPRGRGGGGVLAALCVTEITSWGVLYYAFPVLAPAITADTGWSITATTAAFSAGLLLAAIGGIPVGRLLDRRGPRALMTIGSIVAALAVAGMAAAPTLPVFAGAWLLAGVAMAAVLYQPAFAALTRYYEPDHLPALTTLTLVAGLSSTVFAPLTDTLASHLSWRGTYTVLAIILAGLTIPLHATALRRPWPATSHTARSAAPTGPVVCGYPFWFLTASLTLATFSMFAVLTNLIPLLTARGASPTTAAWALGLGGIGQVAGRIGYATLTRRTSIRARTVAILVASAATTAALAALPGPIPVLIAVAMLAGTARGITTLLQATAVSDRWGTASYATLSGILSAPIVTATALAPATGTALASALGGYPALFTALSACAALAAILATGSVPNTGKRPNEPAC